jgi:hypothetical protein
VEGKVKWRRVPAIASIFALSACVAEPPRNTDIVKTTDAAIRVGKSACSPEDAMYLSANWQAEFHRGVWRVWLYAEGASYGPTYETEVTASDGKASNCTIRVQTE